MPEPLGALEMHVAPRPRERLRDVHKKFIWDEEYGDAYETVRDHLLREIAVAARRARLASKGSGARQRVGH